MHRFAWSVAVLLAPWRAEAAAPQLIPVTGYLTDDAGAPMSDTIALKLALYTDTSFTAPVWSEVQGVDVANGQFTAYMGAETPLDLALFRDHPALYLGMTIGTGAEMTPRFRVATAPYAGLAAYADDAGTVGGLGPTDLQQVSDPVAWSDLAPSTVPAGLADGDDDTTYAAGSGLTLASGTLSADRTTLEGWARAVTYDSLAELRADLDAVYAAKQACTQSQVLAADASGGWVCTDSTALPIGASFVDAAVANNGYALDTDLAALSARATTTQGGLGGLGTTVATLDTTVTGLQGAVSTAQGTVTALAGVASGTRVDYRYAQTNAAGSLSGTIPWDDTIPQITEGNEILTVTITPKKATDLLVFDGTVNWTEPSNTADYFTVALFKDAQPDALATAVDGASNGNGRCTASSYSQICTVPFRFNLVAGGTATATYRLRVGINSGNVYINGGFDGRKLGGALYSTLSVTEFAK